MPLGGMHTHTHTYTNFLDKSNHYINQARTSLWPAPGLKTIITAFVSGMGKCNPWVGSTIKTHGSELHGQVK